MRIIEIKAVDQDPVGQHGVAQRHSLCLTEDDCVARATEFLRCPERRLAERVVPRGEGHADAVEHA